MTAPSLAIAVLTTGERVPLTDSWDEAQKQWRKGGYDPDDVVRIEQMDSETPGSASPEPMPVATVQLALI